MRSLWHDVEVDELNLHRFEAQLRRPFRTARGIISAREVVLVELRATVAGLEVVGWGEAAPLPGWSTETFAQVRYDLGRARDAAFAGAASRPDKLAAMLRTPTAQFAFSSAMLDAVAHARGKTLRRLVDPDAPHWIEVNATIGLEPPAVAAKLAEDATRDGFATIKIKVGDQHDVARVAAVRSAAPNIALRLDANGAWPVDETLQRLTDLWQFGIEYVEEPTTELAGLCKESPVPIAADESCLPLERAEELVRQRAIDVLVLKPALLGAWEAVAGLVDHARQAEIKVVFTSAIDTLVGRAATAQMAAALLGENVACGLATGWFKRDVAEDRIAGGRLMLGGGNGIGFVPRFEDHA